MPAVLVLGNDTPLPFSVRARIIVGLPFVARASANAARSASTSWPSTTIACQPNARQRAAMRSMSCPNCVARLWPRRVDVDDRAEVVELVELAPSGGLPHRAFGHLAVAHQHVGAVVGEPMRRALSAMPTPAARPWPSEPVATSTNGRRGVGWPSRSDSSSRSFSELARAGRGRLRPTRRRASARRGPSTARSGRSRSLCGFCGSKRISPKNSVGTISAAEQHVVGGRCRLRSSTHRIDAELGGDVLERSGVHLTRLRAESTSGNGESRRERASARSDGERDRRGSGRFDEGPPLQCRMHSRTVGSAGTGDGGRARARVTVAAPPPPPRSRSARPAARCSAWRRRSGSPARRGRLRSRDRRVRRGAARPHRARWRRRTSRRATPRPIDAAPGERLRVLSVNGHTANAIVTEGHALWESQMTVWVPRRRQRRRFAWRRWPAGEATRPVEAVAADIIASTRVMRSPGAVPEIRAVGAARRLVRRPPGRAAAGAGRPAAAIRAAGSAALAPACRSRSPHRPGSRRATHDPTEGANVSLNGKTFEVHVAAPRRTASDRWRRRARTPSPPSRSSSTARSRPAAPLAPRGGRSAEPPRSSWRPQPASSPDVHLSVFASCQTAAACGTARTPPPSRGAAGRRTAHPHPGDGIGPEVTAAVVRILEAAGVAIEWETHDAGVAAVEKHRPDAAADAARLDPANKVALKGPVTTPVGEGFTSVNVGLRKALEPYANLRPVYNLPGVPSRFQRRRPGDRPREHRGPLRRPRARGRARRRREPEDHHREGVDADRAVRVRARAPPTAARRSPRSTRPTS